MIVGSHQPARRHAWKRSFARGFQPPPGWTVSEWADRRRKLSKKASAKPGQWSTAHAPYQREIMDCLSDDHPCDTVVFMASAQVGKTEVLLNWAGYTIDIRPSPMMLVLPTVGIAEDFSKQRISGLVTDTPTIATKMGGTRGRSASNTILNKEFPGGMILLRGANSASGLRSVPVQKLAMDEIDGYPKDVDGEGDPVKLAEARLRTYGSRRKAFYCSTPTIKDQSRIEEAYEETDQRKYFVPCPHCGCSQILRFPQLKWPSGEPENAAYECEACEELIDEHEKTKMLAGGNWVSTSEDGKPGKIGFHLNAIYSPAGWISWADIASEFIESKSNPLRLRTFVNTILGETWESKGEQPDWEKIYGRRERYHHGTVPEGAVVLTAGVDVQQDRLEVEVVGWGKGLESWSVDYQVIQGKPSELAVWEELDKIRTKHYPHELGEALTVSAMFVDSGYSTQNVYAYCRRNHPREVMAIRGRDNLNVPIGNPRAVDFTQDGRKIHGGAKFRYVGTNVLKDELYGWLMAPLPGDDEEYPAGWCHFPERAQEYFKQLCSEKLVVKTVRGRTAYTWEKTRDRNEALDCRIYARAAAVSLELDRYSASRWQTLREQLKHKPVAMPVQDVNRDYRQSDRDGRGRRKGSFQYE